jgi:predicted nucleic acid-binding protein
VIVLDASAVIELLMRTAAGNRVETRIYSNAEKLHAPHLIDIEVAQVIRRFEGRREVAPDRGALMLQYFCELLIIRHNHSVLLERIWYLRHNLTAYDATYVALAETLDAPLLTCDRKIAKATNHRAKIELI